MSSKKISQLLSATNLTGTVYVAVVQDGINKKADPSLFGGSQNLSNVLSIGNDGGGRQISNIADPTSNQDVVTLAYFNAHSGVGSIVSVSGTANQIVANTVAGAVTLSLPNNLVLPNGTTATTQAASDNSTKIATTAYVDRLSLAIGTGLTNTLGTLTADLATGKLGGQSVIGGTASGDNLTLSSTSNATKGYILFGASSYSEAKNNFSFILSTNGSSLATTATATANNQYAISETGIITGRSNVTSDSTNGRLFDYTFVAGAGTTTPSYNGVVIKGTFPTAANGQCGLLVNPTMNGASASSFIVDMQAANTSKFKVAYNGDATGSGTTFLGVYSTSAGFNSPKLQISSSGTNADFIIFNSATTPIWRFRATNINVFTFNDGTNDIFTVSSSLWTFNRVIKFGGTNTTGAGSAALGSNSPATTNTSPYTWIQVTTLDGSTGYIPIWK